MTVREALEEIYAEHGTITPELVVDVATDPAHALHPRFEWDDSKAGYEYRKVQAGRLIRSVRIKFDDRQGDLQSVRKWLPVRQGATPTDYQPAEEVLHDPLQSKLILQRFKRAAQALQREYGHLEEYRAVVLGILGEDDAA